MNKTILIASVFVVYVMAYYGLTNYAFAQYMGNVGDEGETGARTLEETLELARRKIEAAEANPASGSGTPYLAADGVLGASAIAAAVFGGIAGALFFKGRNGKYAAQGRG